MAIRHDSAQGHARGRRQLQSSTERILMQMDQFQAAFIASARELDRAVDHLREQTAANTMALQTQPWPLQYVVLAALWALTTVALLFF